MAGVANEVDAAFHANPVDHDANAIVIAKFAEWTAWLAPPVRCARGKRRCSRR
jgi:hypothetical protein